MATINHGPVRVFDIPFFFKSYSDLDYVRNVLAGEIRKKFEEKGYVLLSWGDVGPVQLFTNAPIKSISDLRATKMWAWNDDPLIRALFSQLGVTGVPLGVPDVLPSLQTGLINACYGSPLSTLSLQWQSKVKYITSMVIGQSGGAMVVTKNAWDSLAPGQQGIVTEESKTLGDRLLRQVRDDNDAAIKKMQSLGLQIVPTPDATVNEFQKQAQALRGKLDGQIWTKEWRLRVEQVLAGKK